MPIDYPPPPAAPPAEIRPARETLTRSEFASAGEGRSVDVEAVAAAAESPGVARAVHRADRDGDGRITGRERDGLFDELDRFDRDGSYHSIRLRDGDETLALGRAVENIEAHTSGAPPVRSAIEPPARRTAAGKTLTRDAFIRDGAGRSVDVEAVAAATSDAPGVGRALRRADRNRDGRITPDERDALFTELDHFDANGSAHSVRLSEGGRTLALGRAFEKVEKHSSAIARAASPQPVQAPRVLGASTSAARSGSVNRRLLEWYRQPSNYQRVRSTVGSTYNMCANFLSTALEQSGALEIPHSARYVGFDDHWQSSVRAWAPSLARYLEREHGFQRIYDARDMRPGDIAFTSGREGSYNHVYMIESWVDQTRGVARIIDNQGFGIVRSLQGGGQSPTIYALRSPR